MRDLNHELDQRGGMMRAFFSVPVNPTLPSDYPTLDDEGTPYAVRNRYSVEMPPGMGDGAGYLWQLLAAGVLWRLAVYSNTFDSNGDDLDRPTMPDLRELIEYEDSH